MKIAFCIHYMGTSYDELSENIDQLIEYGDEVFAMINDDDLRDQMVISYADEPSVHVSQIQQKALPADLSLPRGQIIQLRNALDAQINEHKQYDRFIVMSDGMLPLCTRRQLVDYLDQHEGKDIYYVVNDSSKDSSIEQRFENYAFFTNTINFQTSKMIKGMNAMTSKIVHNFKQRKIDDILVQSYPWFILTPQSAKILADEFAYCSNTFKMCLYPEELAIATMLRKFSPVEHINEDIWVCGPSGNYKSCEPIAPLTQEAIDQKPHALFGTKIKSSENLSIYQNYFDQYAKES